LKGGIEEKEETPGERKREKRGDDRRCRRHVRETTSEGDIDRDRQGKKERERGTDTTQAL